MTVAVVANLFLFPALSSVSFRQEGATLSASQPSVRVYSPIRTEGCWSTAGDRDAEEDEWGALDLPRRVYGQLPHQSVEARLGALEMRVMMLERGPLSVDFSKRLYN